MDTRQLQRAAQVVVSILSNLELFLLLTAVPRWPRRRQKRASRRDDREA